MPETEQMEGVGVNHAVLKSIDYYTKPPAEVFDAICDEESGRPISEEQVEKVVFEARRNKQRLRQKQ